MLGIFVFNGCHYMYLHCSCSTSVYVGRPRTDHGQPGADIWSCLFEPGTVLSQSCPALATPRSLFRLDQSTSCPYPTRSFQLMAKVESTDDNLYDGIFLVLSLVLLSF